MILACCARTPHLGEQQKRNSVRERNEDRGDQLSQGRSGHIGRLVAEFFVIVVGVLVALAVDRGAAALDERDTERTYLVALREDFLRNRQLAESKVLAEQHLDALGTELLVALERPSTETATQTALLGAEVSGWQYPLTYRSGAWDDLQSTTGAVRLRDRQLRIALSDFYASRDFVRRIEDEWLEYILAFRAITAPALPSGFRLDVLESFPGWEGDLDEWGQSVEPEALTIVREMANSPQLASRLVDVLMARKASASIYASDVEEIDELLTMIDRALSAL